LATASGRKICCGLAADWRLHAKRIPHPRELPDGDGTAERRIAVDMGKLDDLTIAQGRELGRALIAAADEATEITARVDHLGELAD
jgi:hypothetical protein